MRSITVAVIAAVALAGCTSTQRINVMQPGDRALTCAQLQDQFVQLDAIKRDGQRDQGVNVANAAALFVFWPAIAGNYLSARDSIKLAEERHMHLMSYYDAKSCDDPANAATVVQVPAALVSPVAHGSI